MAFYTYIIYSKSADRFYIGHTEDLEDRLNRHNNSGSKYTKKAKDWALKWSKAFGTRSEAMALERKIKRKKSRGYIEYLVKGGKV